MSFENVTVIAGGIVYDNWETIIIENDMEVGYVNVLLTTTEITPIGEDTQAAFNKWNFPPGTTLEIYANDDLVCVAIVWQYAPSADATQHSITVYARTSSYAFVKSSVDPRETGGAYENTTDHRIIADWAEALGIRTLIFGPAKKVDWWQIRQGATGYSEGLRLLKPRGKLLFGMMDGSIAVSDGRALGLQGPIVQGINILRMQARLTNDDFPHTIVNGQTAIGVERKGNLQVTAEVMQAAKQGLSLRNRALKLITEPSMIDHERAIERARWETARTEVATIQAMITVPGWHSPSSEGYIPKNRNQPPAATSGLDGTAGIWIGGTEPGGGLWHLMTDTYIYAPWLKIDCVMRATRVVFKQSLADGSTTELTFTDPTTFDVNKDPTCNSGAIWQSSNKIRGGIGHM